MDACHSLIEKIPHVDLAFLGQREQILQIKNLN